MTPEMGTTRISIPAGFRGARTESRGDQTSRPQLRLSNCQTVTSAPFPEGVTAPAQYGARICAFVVYLLNYHFLPEDRLAELLSDLFGLKMVPATIARMSAACAQRFRDFADTKLANDGVDTRSLQAYMDHKNIQHTVPLHGAVARPGSRDFGKTEAE